MSGYNDDITRRKILYIGLVLAVPLFVVLQYLSYLRNEGGTTCLDCSWRFGFPFPLYEYGGFVSYESPFWLGFFGDVAFAFVVGLCLGFALNRIVESLRRFK